MRKSCSPGLGSITIGNRRIERQGGFGTRRVSQELKLGYAEIRASSFGGFIALFTGKQ
jgi:hypothetical protein